MSDGLTITPAARIAELKQAFRRLVPKRKLGREGWRHIAAAASIQQVCEMAILERAVGVWRHDRTVIEGLKHELTRHLKMAGAQFNQGKG